VFQVGINFAEAAKLTGTCAAELAVRRTAGAGRYPMANGPAMFDTTCLDRTSGIDRRPAAATGLQTAGRDEVLCIAQSDRHPRTVHTSGRSRAELSDRRVIDTPVRTPSVSRQYGRCDAVTFTKIVNSLRASRYLIIVRYHEAAIHNFVIERIQSFNRRFIHVAIKPQYSCPVDRSVWLIIESALRK
jgi:hypothetical protein